MSRAEWRKFAGRRGAAADAARLRDLLADREVEVCARVPLARATLYRFALGLTVHEGSARMIESALSNWR